MDDIEWNIPEIPDSLTQRIPEIIQDAEDAEVPDSSRNLVLFFLLKCCEASRHTSIIQY